MRPAVVAGTIVLLALTFVVVRTEPDEAVSFAPFAQEVELGERAIGRNIAAQVDDAVLADVVELDGWRGTTTGVWLVVDAQVAAVVQSTLPAGELQVGDRRWIASGRPGTGALQNTALSPGLPMVGALVFELPRDIAEQPGADRAQLRISAGSDARLDSVIALDLNLADLAHEDEFEASPAERVIW